MATKKKILYVITKSIWGGAQKYVYDLATNLPQERFEITVAAGGSGLLLEKLQKAQIRIITIPGLQRDINFLKELTALWQLFKIFVREKPDIIHLNSSKVGGLGAVAAKLSSLVTGHWSLVVFTVHGWPFNEPRPWWQKIFIKFLSWLGALFQDKIILINTADHKAAQKFIPRRKLALIFNGIGEINFLPRSEARMLLAQKIGKQIVPDTIVTGTVAELTKNKGLDYLISTLSELGPNYQGLTLVFGEGEEKEKLKNNINALKLQDNVFLLGFAKEATRALKGLDIFVLPSLKEGLPYTIMEAMQAGLPIIATDVGGIPDLITDKQEGLLVSPKNPQELGEAIKRLAANPEERALFGHRAAEKVAVRFTLYDMIKNTITTYGAGTAH